jgi:hypothetical protein
VRWIESWLSERTQRVCIHGVTSKESPVDSGVPQGTSIFTVYIDDLELAYQLDVKVVKFACDTKGAKVIVGDEFQLAKVQSNASGNSQPCIRVLQERIKAG